MDHLESTKLARSAPSSEVLHEASQECWIQWVSKMDDNGEDSQGCSFMKTVRSTSS